MAGKGFRVDTPPTRQVVYADPETKRFVPPPPPKVIDESRATGTNVIDYVQANQAPEHPTPGGKNHLAEEIPPVKATPPPKPPMRLK
jgi:hypothetical protein